MDREPRSDRDILNQVSVEWMKNAANDFSVLTVVQYLAVLEERFGDEFTIEGASREP